ncbi:MAG TPA: cytochrome b/b6 domain-containing protein [Rhizomicrobium sp.]|nr:cytochrome b/b6 domain-containing protein [Rhizomicrobium sp.]
MTIASEPANDRASRGAAIWAAVLNFLKYGARSDPNDPRVWFYRHPLFVRIAHWTNAVVLAVMLMSGLQIFNAHSALYWGQQSNFDHPWLSMVAMQNDDGSLKGVTQVGPWRFDTTGLFGASKVDGQWAVRGFPSWITIPGPQWLAMGRLWHFFFAWLFVINGVIFAALAIARGHFWRDLAPRTKDFANLPHEIVHHARLQFPKGEAAKSYNSIQRLTYFSVIFVIAPLIVLTGLTMSPTMDAAFPILPWIFAGRQSARSIHFLCAFAFVLFFLVHMIMVVLSGTWNNVRSMITGNYEIEETPHG